MAELMRERQIWITRGHLAALAVTTLFIAVLAFFIGLRLGQSQADAQPGDQAASAPLLPDPAKEDALEVLLRQVEAAQSGDLTFPRTLTEEFPSGPPALAAIDPGGTTTSIPGSPPPPAPEAAPAGAPTSGWAVQVASFASAEEADAKVAQLAASGLQAYRVATLQQGETWHRVRVGGYATEKDAQDALPELQSSLGVADMAVARAP